MRGDSSVLHTGAPSAPSHLSPVQSPLEQAPGGLGGRKDGGNGWALSLELGHFPSSIPSSNRAQVEAGAPPWWRIWPSLARIRPALMWISSSRTQIWCGMQQFRHAAGHSLDGYGSHGDARGLQHQSFRCARVGLLLHVVVTAAGVPFCCLRRLAGLLRLFHPVVTKSVAFHGWSHVVVAMSLPVVRFGAITLLGVL